MTLCESTKVLCGPANSYLSVMGQFTGNLSYKQTECQEEIFVIKDLQHNLLGLSAIKALALIL